MKNLKLIGSKIIKIEAERNTEFSGELQIKTNIKINSFEKIKEIKDSLKILYDFEVNYGKLGTIKIKGHLFLSGEQKIIKELLKIQKNKEYNSPEYIKISNLIIQKASIKALELEEELNLPIHVKLPTLSPKK
jgi:hypothetical protein